MLLGYKDRAELANREYVSLTSVMEGIVIVQAVPEEGAQGNGATMAVA